MKLTMINDIETMIYTLTIPSRDMVQVKLYPHDRLLLNEIEKSNKISDKLLGLEMLCRRIEEERE